jgi:GDP/UDP-N,N'-diacetylbacillosamine 2-epimerase (hydrolysing)
MKTFYFASYNRASDGAIEHLFKTMKEKEMVACNREKADYIIAVGDRTETFDVVLEQYRENKPIVHLWAGEQSQGTHDEVYRHSMTLMSMMQLCTNEHAKKRVELLCKATGKEPNIYVVGNVMLDDLSVDEILVPDVPYALILYNPVSISKEETEKEIEEILEHVEKSHLIYIWIEPNGDKYSELIYPYVTVNNLPRKHFLGLLKHCKFFITNSSCQYYEAPFFLESDQIVPVGRRNTERESKYANMKMGGATEKIIEILGRMK